MRTRPPILAWSPLSKDSLYNYLGYLEESFVIFTLPVAERSLRKQAMNPKKLHAIDWALASMPVI